MFKQFKTFLVIFLALHASVDHASAQVTGASWVFRGSAQQNNTVLTFNMYDTLNLVCKATSADQPKYYLTFAITKGSSAPTMMTLTNSGSLYLLTVDNAGTLIYSDSDGVQSGYENFIVIPDIAYNDYSYESQYAMRYINIFSLRTTDSATYHCSVCYSTGGTAANFGTSGALTIQVNTKAGQARSSRAQVSSLLTYSAVIMGASKLLF